MPKGGTTPIGETSMIERVIVKNFKRFEEQSFELADHILLAGPNNSGKTTLIQAILTWSFALQRWREKRGPDSKSKAKKRIGVPITNQEFTALPVREMSHLWHDTRIALRKDELDGDKKPGHPRMMSIQLEGNNGKRHWRLAFEFQCTNSEQSYARPVAGHLDDLEAAIGDVNVVHIPPFSGIGSSEPHYDQPYQAFLVGQGKAGETLRNLLLELYLSSQREENPDPGWNSLSKHIESIFGYQLKPPQYNGTPFIICEYLPGIPNGKRRGQLPALDISCAGSGFLQTLLLLAFFYARPSTVLLLDEPDAHLHIILQKQIHDLLLRVAKERRCQLLVATHSEVLIDGMASDRILSFYGRPHRIQHPKEREQIREAIRMLPATDILLAENSTATLYVESESDFNLLRAWAEVLGHPILAWFQHRPFWHGINGREAREAKRHLFALRALQPTHRGVLLLDGDNQSLPDRELASDGLNILRWRRYEAENYLLHPAALRRFIADTPVGEVGAQAAMSWFEQQIPPAVWNNPLSDHDYLASTPASKSILPGMFKAAGVDIPKSQFFLIAHQMRPEELPSEVSMILDEIQDVVREGERSADE